MNKEIVYNIIDNVIEKYGLMIEKELNIKTAYGIYIHEEHPEDPYNVFGACSSLKDMNELHEGVPFINIFVNPFLENYDNEEEIYENVIKILAHELTHVSQLERGYTFDDIYTSYDNGGDFKNYEEQDFEIEAMDFAKKFYNKVF